MTITIPDMRNIQLETNDMVDRYFGFTFISIIVPKYNNTATLETILGDIGFTIYSKDSIILESKDTTADVETFLTIQAYSRKANASDAIIDASLGGWLPAYIMDIVEIATFAKYSTVSRNLSKISDYVDVTAVSVIKDPTRHSANPFRVVYAMHTSRAGLALITGQLEHVVVRQSAVGYFEVRPEGLSFGRTYKEAIESDEVIPTMFHQMNPLKMYRIALIANTYLKLTGQLTAKSMQGIADSYHRLSHIASAVDTKLDWDGISNLPLPATDAELTEMFKEVLTVMWEENLVI